MDYNINETNSFLHLQYTTITGTNDITIDIPYRNYNANNFMTAL